MRTAIAITTVLCVCVPAKAGDREIEPSTRSATRDERPARLPPSAAHRLVELLRAEEHVGTSGRDARRDSPVGPSREYASAFAKAISAARVKSIVEESVQGYTEVLAACQQEQSSLLTIPFQRADSQQNHCYRF
jgi:hypothetical protein